LAHSFIISKSAPPVGRVQNFGLGKNREGSGGVCGGVKENCPFKD